MVSVTTELLVQFIHISILLMLAAHGNLTVVKLLSIHNATLLTAYLSVFSSKIFSALMLFY